MRIYLASNWASKKRMRDLRDQINALGHTVCADWLDDTTVDYVVDSPKDAWVDLDQIAYVDLFILDTTESSETGGRDVEYGYAWSVVGQCWIVGPPRNIFHSIADRCFDSQIDLLRALSETADAQS